ncbi:hypothetical protein [Egicoccus sp. AB-alg2]|uniref:hypothetical protein n=1 Tax=Egicoccus sp. AB-alg2 TaxID=3242693 RepID=UPI00359DCA0D
MAQQPPTYGARPGTDDTDTVDLTRQEGRQVAEDAKQQAGEVAGTAKEQAAGVASEAMGHARDLTQDAKDQLHQQARQQTEALGGAMHSLGGRFEALARGDVEEAGPVGDYAQRLAGQVDQIANRVDQLGFDGVVDEVQRYARRKPGAFLLGAAVAGFAVSRLARGAQAAQNGGDGAQSSIGAGSGGAGVSSIPPSGTTSTSDARFERDGLTPAPGLGTPPVTSPATGAPPAPPLPPTGSPTGGVVPPPAEQDDPFSPGGNGR